MSPVLDCTSEDGLALGIAAAAEAVRGGEVVVLPTDTVYGLTFAKLVRTSVGGV